MGLLSKYFKKRDFGKTPEPAGEGAGGARVSRPRSSANHRLAFVVQEHHASTLHYDFRLEIDGVLKSWAVPKGPSLDPHEHHLAVQTEDHPYEYRTFEGVIPEGNYGAGNVIIWDEGWYEARKGAPQDAQNTLRAELKKGHITFILHGKKLQGEFALIKMHDAKQENAWLLVKKGDEFAGTQDVTKQDESVKTHRRVDDLGARGKLPDLSAYPHRAAPWTVHPMLSTLTDRPFSREGWLFEIKWDGFRAVGSTHSGEVTLHSRAGTNFLEKFKPVAQALRTFRHDVIVDGEIVVVDEHGAAHFEWLQGYNAGVHVQADGEPRDNLRYYLFDILWCDGRDVRTMPLSERKALLRAAMPRSDVLQLSDDVPEDGEKLFREMQKRGLEGMVAKRAGSPYREGDHGADWLKIKTHQRQEVVIGGFTEPRGSRKYLGSLLVGVYESGQFQYVGHSGGSIPDDQRKQLYERLLKRERASSPFAREPKPNAPVHWVHPELVCEMEFSEWTSDGLMRQPEFKGLRTDKKPQDVHREKTQHIVPGKPADRDSPRGSGSAKQVGKAGTAGSLPFEKTHEDKIFFPKHKYTKGDIFTYYAAAADYILPYLKDRPCSMNRMPGGITGPQFFQKNNDHLPAWVPHADIFSESNNADLHWIVGGRLDTLLYMVQLGCVEINPWNSRTGSLDKPDWIVIDLDPEGVTFPHVITVAQTVRQVCEEWGIAAYPKTSGKTGIHIFIPLHAKYTYEQGKNLAHLIALEVNKRQPAITSVERMPEKRRHKIYLDFLQNREGQTLAAPYSLRPTPDATVSMPLYWDEVKPGLTPQDFTIKNALARLKKTGDLWAPALGAGIGMAKILARIEKLQRKDQT